MSSFYTAFALLFDALMRPIKQVGGNLPYRRLPVLVAPAILAASEGNFQPRKRSGQAGTTR
jgi:hypothetical protein